MLPDSCFGVSHSAVVEPVDHYYLVVPYSYVVPVAGYYSEEPHFVAVQVVNCCSEEPLSCPVQVVAYFQELLAGVELAVRFLVE